MWPLANRRRPDPLKWAYAGADRDVFSVRAVMACFLHTSPRSMRFNLKWGSSPPTAPTEE
jgi:hypothetical protein